MRKDRFLAGRELGRLRHVRPPAAADPKHLERLSRLERRLLSSAEEKERREGSLPKLSFDPALPIVARKDEIVRAIAENRVLVISGETGSGKTTQIPKFCLAAGRGIDGVIGVTQPRRIAATSVSHRIAEELGEAPGRSVGHKIRFSDRTGKETLVKIMTDGVLLAEAQGDRLLNAYDTLIVDEAHERNLNIDFILGMLLRILEKRNDLKLIVTSATIDTEKFSKAFGDAPVIEVSGRMFPVEVRYAPPDSETEENGAQTHVEAAVRAVEKIRKESRSGDILVFMPTERDIRETCELLEGRKNLHVEVLPLYARLSAAEQARIFRPAADRKVIVATNVAETSITIPGIRYVVDTGLARISQYSPRSRTTSLPVVPVSRSSADQRKGRCGRVENGVCIRLYAEDDYAERPLYTPPEILRANLAEVLLRMISLKLGEPGDFPFIDRPAAKQFQDGIDLLIELGGIGTGGAEHRGGRKSRYSLTEHGRLMAKMPLDPRLSRMLIEARTEGCLRETAIIASALSIQDPRERPADQAEAADRKHAEFKDPASDFITLVKLWDRFRGLRSAAPSASQAGKAAKRFCKEYFLSFRRMREWEDVYGQILSVLEESGFPVPAEPSLGEEAYRSRYPGIHRSILTGFLSNIARKKEKNIFRAAKNREVMIFPGSGLFNKPGGWIVAAEMVETSRLFARTVANIESDWVEKLAGGQCRYAYFEPRWERKRGEVIAFEQVSLYGLIVVPRRIVSYGKIDPEAAGEIFIRQGIMEEEMPKLFPFMRHNRRMIESVRAMEDKIRRRELLVGDAEIADFYRERLPGISDVRSLETLIRERGSDTFLCLRMEDLLRAEPDRETLSLFPDRCAVQGRTFDYTYRFDPGAPEDGVTVKIPAAAASAFPAEAADWLVPGLLRDKIEAMIRSLPKAYRRRLVPVAQTVEVILKEIPRERVPLATALSRFVFARFGVDVPASEWTEAALPDHLRMRISITGPGGEELRAGRDRSVFSAAPPAPAESERVRGLKSTWERTGITRWDFPDLPEEIRGESEDWVVYPGLAPGDGCVSLRLFPDRDAALASHRNGVAALYELVLARDLKYLKKILALPEKVRKFADYLGGASTLESRIHRSLLKESLRLDIRTREAFYARSASLEAELRAAGEAKRERIVSLLEILHETRSFIFALEKANRENPGAAAFIARMREELRRLLPDDFLDRYTGEKLDHLGRYIRAVGIRGQRGIVDFEKDRGREIELRKYSEALERLEAGISPHASPEKKAALASFRWSLEELRVSLFAQELKTAEPVSAKRLEGRLCEIGRMI